VGYPPLVEPTPALVSRAYPCLNAMSLLQAYQEMNCAFLSLLQKYPHFLQEIALIPLESLNTEHFLLHLGHLSFFIKKPLRLLYLA